MQSNGSYRKLKDVRPTFLPGGHKVPVSKRIQFNWADPDDRGEYMDIPKDHLEVDHTYQRDTVSIERINSIAREFRWSAFGVLLIIRGSDGTLWVYDGQHRLAAAKLRDDIDDLPCLVFAEGDA